MVAKKVARDVSHDNQSTAFVLTSCYFQAHE